MSDTKASKLLQEVLPKQPDSAQKAGYSLGSFPNTQSAGEPQRACNP